MHKTFISIFQSQAPVKTSLMFRTRLVIRRTGIMAKVTRAIAVEALRSQKTTSRKLITTGASDSTRFIMS